MRARLTESEASFLLLLLQFLVLPRAVSLRVRPPGFGSFSSSSSSPGVFFKKKGVQQHPRGVDLQRARDWSASGTGEQASQLRSGLTSHRACMCVRSPRLNSPCHPTLFSSFVFSPFFSPFSPLHCLPPSFYSLSSQLPKFGIKWCHLSTAYTLFMIFLGCSVASYCPLSYLHTAAVEEAHFSPSLNLQGCKTKPVQKWTAVPLMAT